MAGCALRKQPRINRDVILKLVFRRACRASIKHRSIANGVSASIGTSAAAYLSVCAFAARQSRHLIVRRWRSGYRALEAPALW